MKNVKMALFLTMLLLIVSVKAHAVSWEYSLKSALEKAKTSQKPVMVDFYTTWCGWCKKLDKDAYSNQKVSGLARQFICVKVDADKDPDAASKYNVTGYPTIIFLDYEGGLDERVVGYRDAGALSGIMSSVLQKTKKPAVKKTEAVKAKTAPSAASSAKGEQFVLNGIFYDAASPKALINGTIVKVGDTIEGAKVKNITRVDVELEYGGKIKTLSVK